MRAAFVILLTGLAAGMAGAQDGVAAEDPVEDWLVRMDHAVASISYRGTLVSTGGSRIDTMRIVHRADDSGVRERIYALDGPKREILRDRDQVRWLVSGQASVVVDNPFPTRLFPRIPLTEILGQDSVYEIRAAGRGRVASRSARIIEISPTDGYRYGRRLWLDDQTAMLLRSVVFDAEGRIVEMISFVDIELGTSISDGELDSALSNPSNVARYQLGDRHSAAPKAGGVPLWMPESLPRGFRLSSVGHGYSDGKRYEHLLFSDGLSSFSIYVEPVGKGGIVEHVEARGSMHIYTGSIDERRVTVVGEVPAPTVRLVGRHIRRHQSPVLDLIQ
jgi:sigma-E factor negative regulatory protein RseB